MAASISTAFMGCCGFVTARVGWVRRQPRDRSEFVVYRHSRVEHRSATSKFQTTNRAMTQWSIFNLLKISGLRVGHRWAISGLQSKTPTISGRLLTGKAPYLLVARVLWVMSVPNVGVAQSVLSVFAYLSLHFSSPRWRIIEGNSQELQELFTVTIEIGWPHLRPAACHIAKLDLRP